MLRVLVVPFKTPLVSFGCRSQKFRGYSPSERRSPPSRPVCVRVKPGVQQSVGGVTLVRNVWSEKASYGKLDVEITGREKKADLQISLKCMSKVFECV